MFGLLVLGTLMHTPRLWGRLFGPAPDTVQPVRLCIAALDRIWAEVRVDGDARRSGWMEPGETMELQAQQEIYVWCGQADRLSVTVNGTFAGTLATLTDTPARTPAWFTFCNSDPQAV